MTVKISDTNKNKLNRMNRVAKDTGLGTVIQDLQGAIIASGKHTVTSAEASASKVIFGDLNAVAGEIWQYTRSGSDISHKVKAVRSGSSVTLSGSAVGAILENDVLSYIVW